MRLGLLTDFRSAGTFVLGVGSEVRSWITLPLIALYTLLVVAGTVLLDPPEVVLSRLFFILFAGFIYVALGAEDRLVTVRTVYALAACHASLQWLFGELFSFPLFDGVLIPAAVSGVALAIIPLPLRGALWTALLLVTLHFLFSVLIVVGFESDPLQFLKCFSIVPCGAALIPVVALVRGYPQDFEGEGAKITTSLVERRKLGVKGDMGKSFRTGGSDALLVHAQAWIEARLRGEIGGQLLLIGIFLPTCVLGVANLVREPQLQNIVSFLLIVIIEAGALALLLRLLQTTARERAALTIMGRFAESTAFVPEAGVQLFVWLSRLVCRESAGLVIEGSGKNYLHEGMSIRESNVDISYALALLEVLERSGLKEGVLGQSQIPADIFRGLEGWFSVTPARVLFMRVQSLSIADVRSSAVVIPLKRTAHMLGFHRSYQTVVAMASLLRLAIADIQQRGGEPRSDLLVADEGRIQKLVHRVNNGTQEVLSLCSQLATRSREIADSVLREDVSRLLQDAERTLAVLSWGVSDDRVLAELHRATLSEFREDITVASVVEEIKEFGQYLQAQGRGSITVESEVTESVCVKVVNREFLLAALRQIGWELRGKEATLSLTLQKRSRTVEIELSLTKAAESTPFLPLLKVAELSGATAILNKAGTTLNIEFLLGEARVGTPRESSQWALFVDDNEQVTSFYAKAAEALGVKYRSAHNLAQALALIGDLGKPRFLITDVNLGSENGLDLVRFVREKFGAELPILVVSGERLGGERDLGKTKYLVKPVGRRALFAEISAILGG